MHSFQFDKDVLTVKEKDRDEWPCYFTVIQDPITKIIKFYYSNSDSLQKFKDIGPDTIYSESVDGENFSKPRKILSLHGASTNFHVFIDPNDNIYPYKGIGGQHLRWDHHNKTGCKNRNFINIKNIKYSDPDKGEHTCYGCGLYLFKSKDGIVWNKCQDLPIITGFHKGQKDGLNNITGFDSSLSLIYDKNYKYYYLFCRSNIKGGVRFIQYCKSNDLKNWSDFNIIKTNFNFNMNKHNFYYPHFFIFNNKLIGYTAFYEENNHKQKEAGLLFLEAVDPGNWNVKNKIKQTGFFNKKPHGSNSGRFKNEDHTVNGMIEINGKTFIFIQSNYYNFNNDKPSIIKKYKVLKK